MNKALFEKLKQVTLEEKTILNGNSIEKSLYTKKNQFEIESDKILDSEKLITVRTHTRFTDFPNHKHDYIEMMYVAQGSIHHVIDGKEVTLNQGEILLLNQHSWHEIKKAGMDDIAINFIILPTFFDVVYDMIGYDNVIAKFLVDILKRDDNKGEYLLFQVADILQIQNLVENMIQSLYEKEDDHKENQVTMGLLFMYLVRYVNRTTKGTTKRFEELLVETALDYIAENYKDATLFEISSRLNQPDYAISKLIKQQTGKTFKELLQSRRFYRAEELLMDTDLSIDDIIYAVGYESHSYFFRRFKEKHGITPKQYRKKM